VEIRRKKFSQHTWPAFRRYFLISVVVIGGGYACYEVAHFFYASPKMLLLRPEQIDVTGNHFVSREAVVAGFGSDRGRSVARVPLDARRQAIEQMPWVEQASVERVLPNRIRVELTERKPAAFLRSGSDLMLVDLQGVILERPAGEAFAFPVVTGLTEALPQDERKRRMQIYDEFLRSVEQVRAGAGDRVSEVDLSDPKDLRAVLTGLGNAGNTGAVTVHFGEGDFSGKYRLLADNFSEWQAKTGRVESVDLRYQRQIVVNPETAEAVNPTPAPVKAQVQPQVQSQAPAHARPASKHAATPAGKRQKRRP
jgi:cell division protein FtsQ